MLTHVSPEIDPVTFAASVLISGTALPIPDSLIGFGYDEKGIRQLPVQLVRPSATAAHVARLAAALDLVRTEEGLVFHARWVRRSNERKCPERVPTAVLDVTVTRLLEGRTEVGIPVLTGTPENLGKDSAADFSTYYMRNRARVATLFPDLID